MVKLGSITKAHGTRGEIVLLTENNLEPPVNELLYIKTNRGDYKPVKIEQLRVINKNNSISFFVLFKGIADRTAAENLKGFDLYAEQLPESWMIDEHTDDSMELNGYVVINQDGIHFGYVQEVIDNPAHPLLSVLDEETATAFLIPYVDAYIIDINDEDEVITGQNLENLIDI
jgi:16S rRNA processing protein RimM